MARLVIAVQPLTRSGVEATYAAPQIVGSGGNYFANNGKTILHVKNAHAVTPCNVSITRVRTVDGVAPTARVISVPATKEYFICDLEPNDFNHTDGTVYIDCDFVTTVTVAVLQP